MTAAKKKLFLFSLGTLGLLSDSANLMITEEGDWRFVDPLGSASSFKESYVQTGKGSTT